MNIQMIPLNRLVPSAANVRKTGAATGIDELAASIKALGLLQNLQVQPAAKGRFEVIAGGRRLAALKLLAKEKALAADAPIGCNLLDAGDAGEISLAENVIRLPMHPADQFDAFKALADTGKGPEEIAARFGTTPVIVRQRLKLAAVSPVLLALYRDDELTLDHLMAFTISDNHKAQEAAWFDAPKWDRSAGAIRRRLTAAHVDADDDRARFVTVAAYVAAGGAVITDLFQTEGEGYLADPALLDRLVQERLEREADAVRREGWAWVEIIPALGYDALRPYERIEGEALPLPAKQAKALAKALKESRTLHEAEELTDEEADRLDALEAQIATLSERECRWNEEQMARGGAVLGIGHGGALVIERGLIRAADARAIKAAAADGEKAERKASGPALSARLVDDLIAHRTAALRAVLADQYGIALAAVAHALVQSVFYGSQPEALDVRASIPALRAEDIDDSPAVRHLAQRRAEWAVRLPEDEVALWDWLLTQDQPSLIGLIACCVAHTVKPSRSGSTDQLAAAVALDMTAWW